LREVIQRNKAGSASQLIMQLRPKIIGWGNYYRYSECKEIFSKISHYISQRLRAWSFRIDKHHGRQKVKEKYFPSGKAYYFGNIKYQDNSVLDGKEKDKNEIKKSFLTRLN
jgi:RNA-directed DNA polymerase